MKMVCIYRDVITDDYSLGKCYIKDGHNDDIYVGKTIERGWRDNEANISCVPEGIYNLVLEYSNKFKMDLWELKNVPERSECKFHAANYWRQLNGCISLGEKHIDIDGDGDPDVTNSRNTKKIFHGLMGSKDAQVIIKNI